MCGVSFLFVIRLQTRHYWIPNEIFIRVFDFEEKKVVVDGCVEDEFELKFRAPGFEAFQKCCEFEIGAFASP